MFRNEILTGERNSESLNGILEPVDEETMPVVHANNRRRSGDSEEIALTAIILHPAEVHSVNGFIFRSDKVWPSSAG